MLDSACIPGFLGKIGDLIGGFKDLINAKLLELGFSLEDLDAISDKLDEMLSNMISAEEMEELVAEVMAEAEAKMTELTQKLRSEELKQEVEVMMDAHDVYDAKKTLNLPEPIMSETKFSSPVDIQDADYTTKEDYPQSYGFIDSIKNWIKVNKEKKHSELVLASGTMIKSDKDGNVTMYIKGNLKQVIEGDYSLEVKGNTDVVVKGSKYQKVVGDLDEIINGARSSTSTADTTIKGSNINLN